MKKALEEEQENLEKTILDHLIQHSKILMLDEFEIVNWVKIIDRFDLAEAAFSQAITFDIPQIVQYAMTIVFYIAMAVKILLNDNYQQVKEPIVAYIQHSLDPNFSTKFASWSKQFSYKFSELQDALTNHKIIKLLNVGFEIQYETRNIYQHLIPQAKPVQHEQHKDEDLNQIVEQLCHVNEDDD